MIQAKRKGSNILHVIREKSVRAVKACTCLPLSKGPPLLQPARSIRTLLYGKTYRSRPFCLHVTINTPVYSGQLMAPAAAAHHQGTGPPAPRATRAIWVSARKVPPLVPGIIRTNATRSLNHPNLPCSRVQGVLAKRTRLIFTYACITSGRRRTCRG